MPVVPHDGWTKEKAFPTGPWDKGNRLCKQERTRIGGGTLRAFFRRKPRERELIQGGEKRGGWGKVGKKRKVETHSTVVLAKKKTCCLKRRPTG